ncbi:G-type lectin S-receptor-like serine/threonine-protein kinase At2g19130 [Linum perenne]
MKNPWILISLLCLTLQTHLSTAADRITADTPLSGDQTISSSGNVFVLGFFRPPAANSTSYYIGIWYNQSIVSQQTIVWVANRGSPVSDRFSSELRISAGNLVLLNESRIPIWSTGLTNNSSLVNAVLLDQGNLVLLPNGSNPTPLWQSFDNPADTWLPGGKIGLSKVTKSSTFLTSWKNNADPEPGPFSLELDPSGTSQYFILWNKTKNYWTSGPWDSQARIFSLVPEMRLNFIYNFSYIDNENESYFTYSMYNETVISRFVMSVRGQIQQFTWLAPSSSWNLFWSQPRAQCEVYGYCGGFGSCNEGGQPFCRCLPGFVPRSPEDYRSEVFYGGCVRRASLQCENNNSNRDGFSPNYNIQLPDNPTAAAVDGGGSLEDCEAACLRNCSCSAYAYEGNCSVWHGELLNLKEVAQNGKTIYVKLAASEFSNTKDSSNGVVIGAVVGSIIFLAIVGLIVFIVLRRRNRLVKPGKAVEGSLMAFTYRDMQNATKNFSEKLGGGGFGNVFKGVLADSTIIAVKKLESISQGEKQFRTEVSTIGTIQHVNLVRLRGFCSEGAKRLLVYDYMPNSSLDHHLFKGGEVLDWRTRYGIALGTARGLTYLHEKCRDCIIHCDIKPENILLDGEMCPKVADFGLAKLVGRDFSRVLTTMRGTRGYLAPEWISGVAITAKADVYSYGMMLFEFVSGRRNTDPAEDGKFRFFPSWAASVITDGGDILTLLDPRLEGNADQEELSRVCNLAFWCIQDDETQRPSMGQVVQILEGILNVDLPPFPRSLKVFEDNPENVVFFNNESSTTQSSQTRSNASSQTKSNTSSSS